MKAIEVKDLFYSYDNSEYVIDGISFSVNQGEYVSLVGHNGSGKSTLAKLLIGLYKASKGEIIINDLPLNETNVHQIRKDVALVFQNPDNQFVGATVEDDIAFGLENHNVAHNDMKKIIDDFASKVGMIDFLNKEPTYLSGGQKQRVAIAGALALNPQILIFDESTSMLDPKGKREIRELIRKMRKENPSLTILSITHDIDEAYQSDKVIVLSKGKIVGEGQPYNILGNEELMRSVNLQTPFVLSVLKKLDYSGNEKIKTVDDLVEIICPSK